MAGRAPFVVYAGENVILDFVDPDGDAGSNASELAHSYFTGPAADQVFAQENFSAIGGSTVLWQLTDNLGSVRDLVDNAGTPVAHFDYDAFGVPTTDTLTAAQNVGTRYLYTAREYDAVTGLQYNRARWYDPVAKRWLSLDPIGFQAGDTNLYRYVGNHPTYASDPTGLFEPLLHGEITQTAYNNLLKSGDIRESSLLLGGLILGVIEPDFQFGPSAGQSLPLNEALTMRRYILDFTTPIQDIQDSITSSVYNMGKRATKAMSSLGGLYETGLYDYLVKARNWWQDSDAVPLLAREIDAGLEASGVSDVRIQKTGIYQTHYGDTAWIHAMTTGNITAEQLQERIVDYSALLIERYHDLRAAGDLKSAGYLLGNALHLLQDSYSRSHVVRDPESGCIKQFQFYGDQSRGLHAIADGIRVGGDEYKNAVARSEHFMRLAVDPTVLDNPALLRWELMNTFYKLDLGATAGGTSPAFKVR